MNHQQREARQTGDNCREAHQPKDRGVKVPAAVHIHDRGGQRDAHEISQATESEDDAEVRAGDPKLGGEVRDGHAQGGGNGSTAQLREEAGEGNADSREVIGRDNTSCTIGGGTCFTRVGHI